MRFILILGFLVNTSSLLAQLIILDGSNQPVPFVEITSNNQFIFAQSDINGLVVGINYDELRDDDTLFFRHVSFKNVYRIKRDLIESDTICLKRKSYQLKEFSVSASDEQKNFRNISACYRGFQVNNDSMAYYSDGKVEYVSKAKNHKYENRRKEYRAFTNARLEDEMPHRNIGITYVVTGVPYPPNRFLPALYFKKHGLVSVPLKSGKRAIINRDSLVIGEIEQSANYNQYSFNDVFSLDTRKLFKTEIITVKVEVTMLFTNNRIYEQGAYDNFDNLLYFKVLREVKVKHDKEKTHTNIMSVNELFIEQVWYTEYIGDEEYGKGYGMPARSRHNTEFWKNCDCEAYYPPDENQLKGLHKR